MGKGWGMTVFNSKEELDFISRGQEGNDVLASYYIGGSTDVEKGSTVSYSDYISNESGLT